MAPQIETLIPRQDATMSTAADSLFGIGLASRVISQLADTKVSIAVRSANDIGTCDLSAIAKLTQVVFERKGLARYQMGDDCTVLYKWGI
jgi:phage FluMu protein gp41